MSIQNAWDSYWTNAKPGDTQSIGGVGNYRDLGNGKYDLDTAGQQPAGTGLLGSAGSGAMKPGQVPDGSDVQIGQMKPMLVPTGTPQTPTGTPRADIFQTKPLFIGPSGQLTQPGPGVPTGAGATTSPGTTPAPGQESTTQGGRSINRRVDAATETIEGRVQNLLATGANGSYTNPVVQQAVNATMQQFAGRGLLNSSIAGEAAYQAAVSKAIEIAGPDAQTYFAQGRANQDAANVFERDARGYAQENARLDKQISVDMEKFNADLQYRYNALRLDKESQTEARALAQKYAIEMENIKSVNSAYDLYLRRISDIDANPEYAAEVKIQMKNNAGKDFDLYAKAKGISYGMDLANRFSASDQTPAPAPAPGEPGSPEWRDRYTDYGGA